MSASTRNERNGTHFFRLPPLSVFRLQLSQFVQRSPHILCVASSRISGISPFPKTLTSPFVCLLAHRAHFSDAAIGQLLITCLLRSVVVDLFHSFLNSSLCAFFKRTAGGNDDLPFQAACALRQILLDASSALNCPFVVAELYLGILFVALSVSHSLHPCLSLCLSSC